MTDIVTIEGTETPSSFLGRGQRRVVARTEFVDRLIGQGFVRVVVDHKDPERVLTKDQIDAFAALVVEGVVTPADTGPSADNTVPNGNASKAKWRAFLEANAVEVDPEWTRDQMVEAWRGDEAVTDGG